MPEVPSLFTLSMEAIKDEIIAGDDIIPYVYKLPMELFDSLLSYLPPLALQKLQEQVPCKGCDEHECDFSVNRKKRKRFENFETVWKALYELRWPREAVVDDELLNDWQQMYWEAHLQNCLSAGAEIFSVPSFDGYLGDVQIPDPLLKYIGLNEHKSSTMGHYSKLSYHCQQFGRYARYLKLQNVLCVAEISHLLWNCRLQSLELHWIKSKEHVDGLCKLLSQNSATIESLEFVHCKLSAAFVNAICHSLNKVDQTHGIKNFSIKTSSFLEGNSSLPDGVASFLSSARSLSSLNFSDNHLRRNFAKMVFDSLLDASSSLAILDLSENNISGCFTHFKWTSSNCSQFSLGIGKSLQSLRVLNLRSNNLGKDDADCLKHALVHIPNLEILDLSDNPIEDGVRSLIPYLVEKSESLSPLADLNLEKCELSCHGVTELLEVLSSLKKPLNSLSLADNFLGSKVGKALGRFLCTGIRIIDIEGIALGSPGFVKARDEIAEDLKLVRINISKNRGMMETANFLSKLISRAPKLVEVNAGYNNMPAESLSVISSCLRVAKGKLERLDLTGNYSCRQQPTKASLLDEFQINGKPIVILLPAFSSHALYDTQCTQEPTCKGETLLIYCTSKLPLWLRNCPPSNDEAKVKVAIFSSKEVVAWLSHEVNHPLFPELISHLNFFN